MGELQDRLRHALEDSYDVRELVGRGGMAEVYAADDLKHGRTVAIKVFKPSPYLETGGDRFIREIEFTARLQHPHILTLIDSGASEDLYYYVMPLVDGESLRARLDRDGQLTVTEAVQVAVEVGGALAYAHEKGILHRDIKPANIMMSGNHAMLMDFGVARALAQSDGEDLTETGVALGTPTYMSPEQVDAGRIDARTDQYALACVLFEALAGEPPFKAPSSSAVLAQHQVAEPPELTELRPDVPGHVSEAIRRALAKDPEDRFVDSAAFRDALLSGLVATESGRDRRGRGFWVVAVGAAVAAVSTTSYLISSARDRGAERGGAVATALAAGTQVTFSGDLVEAEISPDGRLLAGLREIGDETAIVVYDIRSGDSRELSRGQLCCVEWSPDGTELSFVRPADEGGHTTAVVGVMDGRVRGVPANGAERWTSDGRLAAWRSAPNGSFIVTDPGTGATARYSSPERGFDLITSMDAGSDGAIALLVQMQTSVHALFVGNLGDASPLDSAGGEVPIFELPLELVHEDSVPLASLRWDGGDTLRFLRRSTEPLGPNRAASSAWARQRYDLVELVLSTRSVGPVLRDLEIRSDHTSLVEFSRSSRGEIAFPRSRTYSNLWFIPFDTLAAPRRLTSGSAVVQRPTFSPDGRTVGFERATSGSFNIFTIPREGGDPTQQTFMRAGATSVVWSADGDSIAFVSPELGRVQVFKMAVGGADPVELDAGVSAFQLLRVLEWAPGPHLLAQDSTLQIVRFDASGHRAVLERAPEGADAQSAAHYSPSGDAFVLSRFLSPNRYVLHYVGADGDRELSVSDSPGRHHYPLGWSSDGQFVYTNALSARSVFRFEVETGEARRVRRLPFDVRRFDIDIAPDGSGMVAAVFESPGDAVVIRP